MKVKLHILISIIILFFSNADKIFSEPRRVLVEFVTGTWCGNCPCSDSIIANYILVQHPQTVVLSYHGPANGSDPMSFFRGNEIIGITGYPGFPGAIFDRQSGEPMHYNLNWQDTCNIRYVRSPDSPLSISFISKNYDTVQRFLSATVNLSALQTLSGNYRINFVITEDKIVYPQSFYPVCGIEGIHNNFIHNWVVREITNLARGDSLNSGIWSPNQILTRTFTTTLRNEWAAKNCKIVVFVYKDNGTIISSEVIQSKSQQVTEPIGIIVDPAIPEAYSLSQNFPNPFNPVTNIHFSIPQKGNVSLKIYNSIGNLISTIIDGFIWPGFYNAEIDAALWSSGVYFYTLKTNDFSQTKKMILIK